MRSRSVVMHPNTLDRGEIAFESVDSNWRKRQRKRSKARKRGIHRGHSIIRGTKLDGEGSDIVSMSRREPPPHSPHYPLPAERPSLPPRGSSNWIPCCVKKIRARISGRTSAVLFYANGSCFASREKHDPTSWHIENDSPISIRSWLALAPVVGEARASSAIARRTPMRDSLGKVLEVSRYGSASGVRERCATSGASLPTAFASMLQVAFRPLDKTQDFPSLRHAFTARRRNRLPPRADRSISF